MKQPSIHPPISIVPLTATPALFSRLEKKGLVKLFSPSAKLLRGKKNTGMEKVYATDPQYGPHKVLAVVKDDTIIGLTTHPDNEDVILVNPTRYTYKPLYLVVGLHKNKEWERRAKAGKITTRDIIAIELPYNSALSAFTVFKDVPHCEVTVPGTTRKNPIFFVTEPRDFAMGITNMHGYTFKLSRRKK